MLEKFVARDHFLEFGPGDEMIIAALDLVRPRLACGVRDGETHAWLALHERLDQAGLARAGRRRDDVQAARICGFIHNPFLDLKTLSAIDSLAAILVGRFVKCPAEPSG